MTGVEPGEPTIAGTSESGSRGVTDLADRVIEKIATRAAEEVDGVVAGGPPIGNSMRDR